MKFLDKLLDKPGGPMASTADTIIGGDAVIEGKIDTSGDVFVEGTFLGHIRSKGTVVLNRSGHVKAQIHAQAVVVHGEIEGNIVAVGRVDVGASGKVRGDIHAAAASIAEGGRLIGLCTISAEDEDPIASSAATAAPTPRADGDMSSDADLASEDF